MIIFSTNSFEKSEKLECVTQFTNLFAFHFVYPASIFAPFSCSRLHHTHSIVSKNQRKKKLEKKRVITMISQWLANGDCSRLELEKGQRTCTLKGLIYRY